MAGNAIFSSLKKHGYGNKNCGGSILKPSRSELDLTKIESVKEMV